MRRILMLTALLGGFVLSAPAAPLQACPLCKAANESDQNGEPNLKPKAYMYSILFMLAMPATLLGTYGVVFWRASKSAGPSQQPPLDAGA